jgi:hypothetical protein
VYVYAVGSQNVNIILVHFNCVVGSTDGYDGRK